MEKEGRYDSLLFYYGLQYNHDWMLLKAQVKQESSFISNATNKGSQAKGLGQIIPGTFNEWAGKLRIKNPNPYNPEHSIQIQSAYMDWLRSYLSKYLEDKTYLIEWMLAGYNWGPGNVLGLISSTKGHYLNAYNNMPAETQDYIVKIKKYYKEYIDINTNEKGFHYPSITKQITGE